MPKKRAEKLTSKDCRACGLCCISLHDQEAYCDITEEDEKRLGKKFVRLHVLHPRTLDTLAALIENRRALYAAIKTRWLEAQAGPFKGVSACACVALEGSLMHKVKCSIYEKRPRVCHDAVKPGDKNCLEIRRMFKALLEEQLEEAHAQGKRADGSAASVTEPDS